MSKKTKTAYVCNDCGADYNKWQGQCTECGQWNTLSEVRLGASTAQARRSVSFTGYAGAATDEIKTLDQIAVEDSCQLHRPSFHLHSEKVPWPLV